MAKHEKKVPMQGIKLVSIVIPFYNEEKCINIFHEAMLKLTNSFQQYQFEFICVDDGSEDKTLEMLKAISCKDARFKTIELSRNFGKEAALTAGIDESCGDAVLPFDADLQDPPEVIPKLLEKWEEGFEVVLAKRNNRSSDSFLKRQTAVIFYRVHNILSSVKIPPNVGDFRLMDRVVVDSLKLLPERQRFMKGLFAWVGYKTTTIEYVRTPRAAGETNFSTWKLWNFALEGITSFSIAPLRIWTYLGFATTLVTLVYIAYIVISTMIFGNKVPGYPSLLVAVLFFGSAQLISLGILGEYVGRIYIESKNRPNYLIRNKRVDKDEINSI